MGGGCIIESISSSLASMDLSTANVNELQDAAQLIVESASHILQAFDNKKEVLWPSFIRVTVSRLPTQEIFLLFSSQKSVATSLVNGLDAVQSFMLANKLPDLEPAIITAPHISIYANR